MKFRDFFVPKYVHSDPNVRIKFINNTDDERLLKSIIENDKDKNVTLAAKDRIHTLKVTHREQ